VLNLPVCCGVRDLLPDEDFSKLIGWLEPNGTFHRVLSRSMHDRYVYETLELDVRDIERAGWVRVTEDLGCILYRWYKSSLWSRLTEAQKHWLVSTAGFTEEQLEGEE
jgi:hypothetical protein